MKHASPIIPRWYDSASQKMLPLAVPQDKTVNIYACGITPYSAPHIGHARSFVIFDAFAKTLRSLGWSVDMVRNITDIDDKIIQRAFEQNTTWKELSEYWADFNRTLFTKLGVTPTFEPKVSESMGDIQDFIQKLIEKNHAYKTPDGNVYFSIESSKAVDVAHQPLEDLKTQHGQSRVTHDDKSHPADFVLWKTAKPGEPFWESPWGKGRPGWHIECSAMIEKHFKGPIDIHGGGIDLRFPHHACESHQSEAYLGRPLSTHWVHHGSVLHSGQKMSKSLGNVVPVEDLLVSAEKLLPGRGAIVARMALLSAHWQKPLDWSESVLERAAGNVVRLEQAIQDRMIEDGMMEISDATEKKSFSQNEGQAGSDKEIVDLSRPLMEALADNFNTPLALNLLQSLVKTPHSLPFVHKVLQALGFDEDFWPFAYEKKEVVIPSDIQNLLIEREKARKNKDFKKSDELRNQIIERGWVVQDGKKGQTLNPK